MARNKFWKVDWPSDSAKHMSFVWVVNGCWFWLAFIRHSISKLQVEGTSHIGPEAPFAPFGLLPGGGVERHIGQTDWILDLPQGLVSVFMSVMHLIFCLNVACFTSDHSRWWCHRLSGCLRCVSQRTRRPCAEACFGFRFVALRKSFPNGKVKIFRGVTWNFSQDCCRNEMDPSRIQGRL